MTFISGIKSTGIQKYKAFICDLFLPENVSFFKGERGGVVTAVPVHMPISREPMFSV